MTPRPIANVNPLKPSPPKTYMTSTTIKVVKEVIKVREIVWLILLVMVVTILANVLAFIIVGALIFLLSMFAFRKEIDPDNFAIPLTACLADMITAGFIIIFSFAMLPGVGGDHEVAAEAIRNIVSTLGIF